MVKSTVALWMQPNPPAPDGRKPQRNPWALAWTAGSGLALSVLVGLLAGKFIDDRSGAQPWFTVVGAVLGIAFGLYKLIRDASKTRSADR